ncbi:MAG: tRNA (adenosine(37)-N6)-threonylcarbamoyltransferase complex ATPase subunit type 1 TsaE [Granulosicoccus sp.]
MISSNVLLDELLAAKQFSIDSESAMREFGGRLSKALPEGALVTLSGELGAGKSVLARSIIHSLGYEGRVKSPTYTLIETYEIEDAAGNVSQLAHLDLYRLSDPEELDYLAFDDVLRVSSLVLIEWAELGGDRVPAEALHVDIEYAEDHTRLLKLTRPKEPA